VTDNPVETLGGVIIKLLAGASFRHEKPRREGVRNGLKLGTAVGIAEQKVPCKVAILCNADRLLQITHRGTNHLRIRIRLHLSGIYIL